MPDPRPLDVAALTASDPDRHSLAEVRSRIRAASHSAASGTAAGEVFAGTVLLLGALTLATLFAHVVRMVFGGTEFHPVSIGVAALMVGPVAIARSRSFASIRRARTLERFRLLGFADDNDLDLAFDAPGDSDSAAAIGHHPTASGSGRIGRRAQAFSTGDSRRAEVVVRSERDGFEAQCFGFTIHRNRSNQAVELSSIAFDAAHRDPSISVSDAPTEAARSAEVQVPSVALPEFVLVTRDAGARSPVWAVPSRMVETPVASGFDEHFTTWCLPGGESRVRGVLTESVRNELVYIATGLDLEVVDGSIVVISRQRLAIGSIAFWELVEDLTTIATDLVAASTPDERLGDYWDSRPPVSADPDRRSRRNALLAPPRVARMFALGCLTPLIIGTVAAALSAGIGH